MSKKILCILLVIYYSLCLLYGDTCMYLRGLNIEIEGRKIWKYKYNFNRNCDVESEDKLLEYWSLEKDMVRFLRENERSKELEIRELEPKARALRDCIATAINGIAKKSVKARKLFYDEYKVESDKDELSTLRTRYLFSSPNYMRGVFNLWGMHDGRYDFRLLQDIEAKLNDKRSIGKTIFEMTEEYLDKLSNYILHGPIGEPYYKSVALEILSSDQLTFNFKEIGENEYYKRLLKLYFDSLFYASCNTVNRNIRYPTESTYSFGEGENKDKVYLFTHILWYRTMQKVISASPKARIKDINEEFSGKSGLIEVTRCMILAHLGDVGIKPNLRAEIDKESNPILKSYMIEAYGEVADKVDLDYLKKLSKDTTVLKIPEYQLPRLNDMKIDYREEISPIKEAVERIYKKLGYIGDK